MTTQRLLPTTRLAVLVIGTVLSFGAAPAHASVADAICVSRIVQLPLSLQTNATKTFDWCLASS